VFVTRVRVRIRIRICGSCSGRCGIWYMICVVYGSQFGLEFNRINVFDRCHLFECTRNENQAFIFQIMCKSRACNNGPLTWKPKVKKNGNRKKKSKMECRCLKHVICFWIVLFFFFSLFFVFQLIDRACEFFSC